jgi:cytoskeletal protein CcmA (bactofilin family)
MALLQIRRGNNGTKGTLQYGEPFFNSTLQTVQFGASGSEEVTLVKLNTGLSSSNVWGESGSFENSGSLSLVGDITASNAFFRGNVFVSGNLRLGNNDLDSIAVVADFTSDLIPNQSASYDLGTATKYWKTAYVGSLALASLAGADAENNIVYVNNANQLTASNDFEYIPGDQVRIGSGSEDRFWVKINTGDTFVSGNLFVSGNNGIALKANISSSQGFVTAVSAAFDNLRAPGGSNDSIVIASNGYLTNTSDLRFVGNGLDIGNGKFLVNKTNGNTDIDGYLQIRGNITSSANAIIKGTLQVDGGTTLNNQLDVNSRVSIDADLRVDGSGSFGNGITVTGSVVLNAGGAGLVMVSGSTQLGDDAQTDSLSINGSINHLFTGTTQQNLFRRYSAVRSSSLTFNDDNSGANAGEAQLTVTNITDPTKLGQVYVSDTSVGFYHTSGSKQGQIYLDSVIGGKLNAVIESDDEILLNPGLTSTVKVRNNFTVTGSTILGQGGDDLLIVASPTTMSGDVWNQGYTANLGSVKISSSLQVSGSTELLGTVAMGDLTTNASGLVEGSASIAGDLTVRGNAVYLGVDKVSTEANLIEIGSGSTIRAEVEGAGLFISGASAQFVYREVGDRMFLNKGLKIEGDGISGFGLQVSASTYLSGNLEVSGNLDVYGNINLGNVTITNTASIQHLIVNNNISGGNNLNIANNAAISGNLTIFGNEVVNGTLKSNGATTLHSTLNVSGAVGLNTTLRVTGSTAITGGLFVSGNTELSSSLTVKEYSFFEKNMRVSGNLQVDGNLEILGDVTQLQVSNLQIEDKNIIIASGSLSSLQSTDAGLTILGPTTPIQFSWDHPSTRMNLNKDLNISGNLLILGDNVIDTAVALAIALG